MSEQWIEIGKSDDLAVGDAIEVVVGRLILAVFRQPDQIYVLDGMCAHQGGPLADGRVEHGCVACPWHGWQYELSTGIQTANKQPLQRTYQVRETDGRIEVLIDSDEATAENDGQPTSS